MWEALYFSSTSGAQTLGKVEEQSGAGSRKLQRICFPCQSVFTSPWGAVPCPCPTTPIWWAAPCYFLKLWFFGGRGGGGGGGLQTDINSSTTSYRSLRNVCRSLGSSKSPRQAVFGSAFKPVPHRTRVSFGFCFHTQHPQPITTPLSRPVTPPLTLYTHRPIQVHTAQPAGHNKYPLIWYPCVCFKRK